MEKTNRAYWQLNLAVLLFGVAGLFGKWIALSALEITFGRVLFGAISIIVYQLLGSSVSVKIDRKLILKLVITGILLAVHWFCFFHAIKISTVAIGVLGVATFSVWTTLLEPLFSNEKLRLVHVAQLALIIVGIGIITPRFNWDNSWFEGMMWATLSGLTYALLQMANRKMVSEVAPTIITGFQFMVAGLLILPFIASKIGNWSLPQIGQLALLGIIFTALAHTLFVLSLKKIKVRVAAIVANLEPVYGIITAAILLNEIPQMNELIGGLVILLTAVWVMVTAKVRD